MATCSENKPVRCGCGGEANIHKDDGTFGQMPIYTVSCNTCGMRSGRRSTEAEAVIAWNRAMGERKKGWWEVLPSTNVDGPFIWWKCSECCNVIYSETERDRREFHAFCGRCGAEMTRGDR